MNAHIETIKDKSIARLEPVQNTLSIIVFFILSIAKWPVFVIAIYLIPTIINSILSILNSYESGMTDLYILLFGASLMWLVAFFYESSELTRLGFLEREFSRLIVQILSFNRIDGLVVHDRGGYIKPNSRSKQNWVTVLAPYLFPVNALLIMSVMLLVGFKGEYFLSFMLMYHLQITSIRVHRHCKDINHVLSGVVFSIPVIIASNLLAYLYIYSYILEDLTLANVTISEIFQHLY